MIVQMSAEEIEACKVGLAMLGTSSGSDVYPVESAVERLRVATVFVSIDSGMASASDGIDRTAWANDAITITFSVADRAIVARGLTLRLADLASRFKLEDDLAAEADRLRLLFAVIRPPSEQELAIRIATAEARKEERAQILVALRARRDRQPQGTFACNVLTGAIQELEGST